MKVRIYPQLRKINEILEEMPLHNYQKRSIMQINQIWFQLRMLLKHTKTMKCQEIELLDLLTPIFVTFPRVPP